MFVRTFTHSGVFHADEIFALAAASCVVDGGDSAAVLTRTRDEAELAAAVQHPLFLVVDVGGQYDTALGNYDHHQRGFISPGEREMSSFGLVWKDYGPSYVKSLSSDLTDDEILIIAAKIDESIVACVDAIDTRRGADPGAFSRYTISSLISSYNDEPFGFQRAFDLASRFLKTEVQSQITRVIEQRGLRADLQAADAAGEKVVKIERWFPGWPDVVAELSASVMYGVFYDSKAGSWRVQQIPESPGASKGRKALPEPWRGLPSADLQALTGVSDAVFCHPNGFIAGVGSEDGANALANIALNA